MTSAHPDADGVLYQDARWTWIARFQYGWIAYPLWIAGLIGSISTGVPSHVLISLALFTPPIAICEWRLRKMGLIVNSDAIVLVRPLNRTRIPWQEIESFALVSPPGWIDYGNRRIAVKRRHGVIPRFKLQIPTIWLSTKGDAHRAWPRGPSRLRWSGGEIADVLGFLNEELVEHRSASENVRIAGL